MSRTAPSEVNAKQRPVFGRDQERLILDEMIAGIRMGMSSALALWGDAGMGKTLLLDYAADMSSGLQIRRVAGIEAERGLGFGGLHRLLLPTKQELATLPELQRGALVSAFGVSQGTPPDVFLVGLATLTMLASTASPGLLCLIDDVHWLDHESLRALAFVARRLKAEGIAMVFSTRSSGDVLLELQGITSRQVDGLPEGAALELLNLVVPGVVDPT